MEAFVVNAGGLAAACTIVGWAALWFFRLRQWRNGTGRESYSPLLASLTVAVFTAAPLVLWYAAAPKPVTLTEAVTATCATGLTLHWRSRAARKAMRARLSK